jgi:hypothetical protein
MSSYEEAKGVRLSTEDQGRLVRLREEILARADEIDRIINRTLQRPVPGSLGKIVATDSSEGYKNTIVERYDPDGKLVAVGCWDEEAQECYPGPCPE